VISFAAMVMASIAGETDALRLHATELLIMLGTGIVLTVEPLFQSRTVADTADEGLVERT
jgi:hypothetical protein